MRRFPQAAGASVVLGCLLSRAVFAQADYRIVARAGDLAPGTESGVRYSDLKQPINISKDGQVMYVAGLAGPGINVYNDTALYADGTQGPRIIARFGELAPGVDTPARYIEVFRAFQMIDDRTLFYSNVRFPDNFTGTTGFWDWIDGAKTLRLIRGVQAPGLPAGVIISQFGGSVAANSRGDAVISSILAGTGITLTNDRAIYLSTASGLRLIAVEGGQAPDCLPGEVFDTLNTDTPALNEEGETIVQGKLRGSGVTSANDSGLWATENGILRLVARRGQSAPGLPGEVLSVIYAPVQLNRAGTLAFASRVALSSNPSQFRNVLWIGRRGSLHAILQQGQSIDGLPTGVVVSWIGAPQLGSQQEVVVPLIVTGPGVNDTNSNMLARVTSDSTRILVRDGDRAPGLSPEDHFLGASILGMNVAGDVLVWARIADQSGATNRLGLWLARPNGDMFLVVAYGQQIDVDPDPEVELLKTVSYIPFTPPYAGAEDGRPSLMSDAGEAVVGVRFDDGSTAVVVARVPESRCAGDWDLSGGPANTSDFLAYLNDFADRNPRADLAPAASENTPPGDGVFDSSDFLAFLNLYAQGC